jgi:hypothetical protein
MPSEPSLLDQLANDLVENLHNRHLVGLARGMTGWWPEEESNALRRKLHDAGLTEQQRRVVWSILAQVVADAFHGLVHEVDQELTAGRVVIELHEGDKAQRITELPCMAMAFSSDQLQAHGLNPAELYEQHAREASAKRGER